MRLVCVRCQQTGTPFEIVSPYEDSSHEAGLCEHDAIQVIEQGIGRASMLDERQPVLDFRPSDTFSLNPSTRFAGFEFEMFNRHQDSSRVEDLTADWRLLNCGMAGDGSIESDAGIEIKTPPAQGDDVPLWIHAVCKTAQEYEMRVDQSCGLHVHLNATDMMNGSTLRRLFRLIRVSEPLLYAMVPPARLNGNYSRRFTVPLSTIDALTTRDGALSAYHRVVGDVGSHYYGFNLTDAYDHHHTFEFRYHSGTLNPEKVWNWTRLLLAIMDTAKTIPYRDIPTDFPTFDERQSVLLKLLACADLTDYMNARLAYFRCDLAALNALGSDQIPLGRTAPLTPAAFETWQRWQLNQRTHHRHGMITTSSGLTWCELHGRAEPGEDLCSLLPPVAPTSSNGQLVYTEDSQLCYVCPTHAQLETVRDLTSSPCAVRAAQQDYLLGQVR